jgi:hypothetical protein
MDYIIIGAWLGVHLFTIADVRGWLVLAGAPGAGYRIIHQPSLASLFKTAHCLNASLASTAG